MSNRLPKNSSDHKPSPHLETSQKRSSKQMVMIIFSLLIIVTALAAIFVPVDNGQTPVAILNQRYEILIGNRSSEPNETQTQADKGQLIVEGSKVDETGDFAEGGQMGEMGTTDKKKFAGDTYVEIEILDYTKKITDICQDFEIRARLVNRTENEMIFYREIINPEASQFLDIFVEELRPRIDYVATVTTDSGTSITDFGVLNPGESAEVTIKVADKIELMDVEGNVNTTMYENPFNIVKENGVYHVGLEFGLDRGPRLGEIILGQSALVPIKVEVLTAPGVFKACHR